MEFTTNGKCINHDENEIDENYGLTNLTEEELSALDNIADIIISIILN